MTIAAVTSGQPQILRRIGVLRLAVAGGISAGTLLTLCWVGALMPLSGPTHAFIGLFTTAPVTSIAALVQGLCWSILFGVLTAALFAITYNALRGLEPR